MDTGTINRPLRLRGERGKTHSPFKKHYQIENERYTQRTFHKGLFITQYIRSKHSTRGFRCAKCIAACIPPGVGADSSRPHHQQKQLVVICKILRIAMPTMGKRNTISGKFVDTGTINRPLRLRGERGKTHSPFKKHYQIENERYTQRTFHKGLFITQYIRSKHSTRGFRCAKCIAACIPPGVGADSSRPHHQQKQLVVICKILRIAIQTMGKRYTI